VVAVQVAILLNLMGVHVAATRPVTGVTLGAKRLLPLGVREEPRRAAAVLLPLPLLLPSLVCCTSLAAALAACLKSVTSAQPADVGRIVCHSGHDNKNMILFITPRIPRHDQLKTFLPY